MVAVADLERLLERVFERTSARLFRSRLHVVQVERRVERAMEAGRTGRGTSTRVPNRFRVRLHPTDLGDLARRAGGDEALASGLAERALAFARLHGYHVVARPVVVLAADPIVERGAVEVDASVWRPAGRGRHQPSETGAGTAPGGDPEGATGAGDEGGDGVVDPDAPAAQSPDGSPRPGDDEALLGDQLGPTVPPGSPPRAGGVRHAPDVPYAVRPAAPPPARALLRVVEPGGREREVRVDDEPLTLGRAGDNRLVIADSRVSRHHGRFQNRHGTLVYTDLGSTNGTRVNGIRVDEIVLGAGDRLQLGDVVVVVEQLPR